MEFRFLFKRKRVSSGQRLLVELRRARNTFIVRRLLKGKSAREMSLADWGTFCKRKSSQPTTDLMKPSQPSGGRLGCYRITPLNFCKENFYLSFLSLQSPGKLFPPQTQNLQPPSISCRPQQKMAPSPGAIFLRVFVPRQTPILIRKRTRFYSSSTLFLRRYLSTASTMFCGILRGTGKTTALTMWSANS